MLHPGDASSVQQILQGKGLSVLQVRQNRPKQRGVLTLDRNNIKACLIDTHMEDSEYQVLEIKADAADIQLVNFYFPNDKPLSLDTISTEVSNCIIVGDFNSHSQSWEYQHMDRRGEEVENWQDENRLLLINSPSGQPTFYSRRWHTTSTPDIALCT